MWSQHSRKYGSAFLPGSALTIWDNGCYLCAICSLAQTIDNPAVVAQRNPKAFKKGLVVSERLAEAVGLVYKGKVTKQPADEVCIGVTRHYAKVGVPTHFVICFNDLQADPLDVEMTWKPKIYQCFEYRTFGEIALESPLEPSWFSFAALSLAEQIKRTQAALKRASGAMVNDLQRRLARLLK